MPEKMIYNEAMGDLQAHINLLRNRLDEALQAVETARAKGADLTQAEAYAAQCQEEYDDFMKEHGDSDGADAQDEEEEPALVN